MLEKIESQRRREEQKMRWLESNSDNGHESEQAPGDSEKQAGVLQSMSQWMVRNQ